MLFVDIKEGDKLRADGGFDCIKEGTILEVKQTNNGLYVECENGKHFISDDETGFTIIKEPC